MGGRVLVRVSLFRIREHRPPCCSSKGHACIRETFILPFLNSQQCDAWVKTTSLSTNRYNADGQYSLSETSALHSGSNITHGYCMNDYGFKVTRLSLPRSLWLLSFFVKEGKGRRKGEKKGKRKTVVPPIASIKLRQIQTHSYPLPIAPVRCNGRIFAVVGL